MPRYSVRPVITIAATRSFGVRATTGRIAPITGLLNVTQLATTAPEAYASNGKPAHIAAAVANIHTAWAAYPSATTRSGRNRSPAYAANGATTTAGASWTTETTPASPTPPRWYA